MESVRAVSQEETDKAADRLISTAEETNKAADRLISTAEETNKAADRLISTANERFQQHPLSDDEEPQTLWRSNLLNSYSAAEKVPKIVVTDYDQPACFTSDEICVTSSSPSAITDDVKQAEGQPISVSISSGRDTQQEATSFHSGGDSQNRSFSLRADENQADFQTSNQNSPTVIIPTDNLCQDDVTVSDTMTKKGGDLSGSTTDIDDGATVSDTAVTGGFIGTTVTETVTNKNMRNSAASQSVTDKVDSDKVAVSQNDKTSGSSNDEGVANKTTLIAENSDLTTDTKGFQADYCQSPAKASTSSQQTEETFCSSSHTSFQLYNLMNTIEKQFPIFNETMTIPEETTLVFGDKVKPVHSATGKASELPDPLLTRTFMNLQLTIIMTLMKTVAEKSEHIRHYNNKTASESRKWCLSLVKSMRAMIDDLRTKFKRSAEDTGKTEMFFQSINRKLLALVRSFEPATGDDDSKCKDTDTKKAEDWLPSNAEDLMMMLEKIEAQQPRQGLEKEVQINKTDEKLILNTEEENVGGTDALDPKFGQAEQRKSPDEDEQRNNQKGDKQQRTSSPKSDGQLQLTEKDQEFKEKELAEQRISQDEDDKLYGQKGDKQQCTTSPKSDGQPQQLTKKDQEFNEKQSVSCTEFDIKSTESAEKKPESNEQQTFECSKSDKKLQQFHNIEQNQQDNAICSETGSKTEKSTERETEQEQTESITCSGVTDENRSGKLFEIKGKDGSPEGSPEVQADFIQHKVQEEASCLNIEPSQHESWSGSTPNTKETRRPQTFSVDEDHIDGEKGPGETAHCSDTYGMDGDDDLWLKKASIWSYRRLATSVIQCRGTVDHRTLIKVLCKPLTLDIMERPVVYEIMCRRLEGHLMRLDELQQFEREVVNKIKSNPLRGETRIWHKVDRVGWSFINLLQRHADWNRDEDKVQQVLNLSFYNLQANTTRDPVIKPMKDFQTVAKEEKAERGLKTMSANVGTFQQSLSKTTQGNASQAHGKHSAQMCEVSSEIAQKASSQTLEEIFCEISEKMSFKLSEKSAVDSSDGIVSQMNETVSSQTPAESSPNIFEENSFTLPMRTPYQVPDDSVPQSATSPSFESGEKVSFQSAEGNTSQQTPFSNITDHSLAFPAAHGTDSHDKHDKNTVFNDQSDQKVEETKDDDYFEIPEDCFLKESTDEYIKSAEQWDVDQSEAWQTFTTVSFWHVQFVDTVLKATCLSEDHKVYLLVVGAFCKKEESKPFWKNITQLLKKRQRTTECQGKSTIIPDFTIPEQTTKDREPVAADEHNTGFPHTNDKGANDSSGQPHTDQVSRLPDGDPTSSEKSTVTRHELDVTDRSFSGMEDNPSSSPGTTDDEFVQKIISLASEHLDKVTQEQEEILARNGLSTDRDDTSFPHPHLNRYNRQYRIFRNAKEIMERLKRELCASHRDEKQTTESKKANSSIQDEDAEKDVVGTDKHRMSGTTLTDSVNSRLGADSLLQENQVVNSLNNTGADSLLQENQVVNSLNNTGADSLLQENQVVNSLNDTGNETCLLEISEDTQKKLIKDILQYKGSTANTEESSFASHTKSAEKADLQIVGPYYVFDMPEEMKELVAELVRKLMAVEATDDTKETTGVSISQLALGPGLGQFHGGESVKGSPTAELKNSEPLQAELRAQSDAKDATGCSKVVRLNFLTWSYKRLVRAAMFFEMWLDCDLISDLLAVTVRFNNAKIRNACLEFITSNLEKFAVRLSTLRKHALIDGGERSILALEQTKQYMTTQIRQLLRYVQLVQANNSHGEIRIQPHSHLQQINASPGSDGPCKPIDESVQKQVKDLLFSAMTAMFDTGIDDTVAEERMNSIQSQLTTVLAMAGYAGTTVAEELVKGWRRLHTFQTMHVPSFSHTFPELCFLALRPGSVRGEAQCNKYEPHPVVYRQFVAHVLSEFPTLTRRTCCDVVCASVLLAEDCSEEFQKQIMDVLDKYCQTASRSQTRRRQETQLPARRAPLNRVS